MTRRERTVGVEVEQELVEDYIEARRQQREWEHKANALRTYLLVELEPESAEGEWADAVLLDGAVVINHDRYIHDRVEKRRLRFERPDIYASYTTSRWTSRLTIPGGL